MAKSARSSSVAHVELGAEVARADVTVQQQLTVYMIAARNLKAMDLNGTSDPYMTLEVAETRSGGAKEGFWVGKGVKAKTAVKKNTLNPIWRGESMRNYARVMHARVQR